MAKKKSKQPAPSAELRLAGTDPASKGKKWEVAKVWTTKLAKKFTPISLYFIQNYHRLPYPISAIEFTLIVHLISHKWDDAMPFPKVSTLAKKMLRSEAAVRGAARSLEKKKYLKRYMKRGKPNHFDLTPLFEALEKLYDADAAAKPAKRDHSVQLSA
jgi:DNA-binding MarR family transcriptional regulator